MEQLIKEELYARALGWELLGFLKKEGRWEALARDMEGDALRVLERIQCVLNDETLDDPECFHRVEAIVQAFYAGGLSTSRHDWG